MAQSSVMTEKRRTGGHTVGRLLPRPLRKTENMNLQLTMSAVKRGLVRAERKEQRS